MLIKNAVLERIISGEISLIFRRWKRAGVKTGGTQMTQLGVLGIDAVDIVSESKITANDAKAAGFGSREELLASMPDADLNSYRIKVHWVGEDPRKSLRADDKLSKKEFEEIIKSFVSLTRTASEGRGRNCIYK